MEYKYHIDQFSWNKNENTFFAEAPFLDCQMPDGNIHPEAFPNMKKQFFIVNTDTGGFRRFRFVGEEIIYSNNENEMGVELYLFTQWIFESEDGIKCKIAID
jgi:hypothetical protein